MRAETAETRAPHRLISEAPWTVWAYVATEVLGVVVWMVLAGDSWRGLGGLVIGGAIALGILFGYRAAWVIAVILAAFSLIGTINFVMQLVAGDGLEPERWSSLGFYLASTAVLIHPLTRAWATR
jgi:hypothetical protein